MRPDGVAWATLLGLGAFHGINPAMGWLFAVALGLQERSRRAVLRAVPPIALGHALAIILALTVFQALRATVDARAVAIGGAIVLVAFGTWRLLRRHEHHGSEGMLVRPRELVVWSFVMASVHGAGLMLLPVALRSPVEHPPTGLVSAAGEALGEAGLWVLSATAIHTAAMVAMMAGAALIVYDTVGPRMLRRGTLNLDRIWGVALVVSGIITLFT